MRIEAQTIGGPGRKAPSLKGGIPRLLNIHDKGQPGLLIVEVFYTNVFFFIL